MRLAGHDSSELAEVIGTGFICGSNLVSILSASSAVRFSAALHARLADPVSAYHAQACRKSRRRESDQGLR